MNPREKVFQVMVAASIIAGSTFGCGRSVEPQLPSPTKTVVSVGSRPPELTPTISPETAWAILSPIERIQSLEFKEYPKIENFDPLTELTKATAEFYCQSTNCTTSPQELSERVKLVDLEDFKIVIKQDIGRNLTEEEENRTKKGLNYIVSSETKREIFWNLEAVKADGANISPETITRLEGRDLQTLIYKTVLFQSFFLLERSREEADYPIDAPILGKIKISVREFDLYGQRNDSSSVQTLFTSEAFAIFFTRRIVDKKIGPLISLHKSSREAADLIEEVNSQSGLTAQELLIFFRGQRPIRELLKSWGQNDEDRGLLAMIIIGLRVNNIISQQEAENGLKSLFPSKGSITRL